MPIAPSSETSVNPIDLGLRFGAGGAAAGLGWAAIRKALHARKAERDGTAEAPTAVARPVLAGAMIGMALGTGLGAAAWKRKNMSKYAALLPMLEKKALFDTYANMREANPWKSLASDMVPGVGAATMAGDALHSFSKGKWLAGLGSAAMVPLGLIPGAGLLKSIPRLARLAKATAAGGKGVRSAQRGLATAARMAGPVKPQGMMSRGFDAATVKMFGGRLAGMSEGQIARASNYGTRINHRLGVGRKFDGLQRIPGLRNLTGAGATGLVGLSAGLAGSTGNAGQIADDVAGSAQGYHRMGSMV
jgi:hypothetical protein